MNILVGNLETLDQALGELTKEKLPLPISFKIARFIRFQLSKELSLLPIQKSEIANEFCIKDDSGQPLLNGNLYQFTLENENKANERLKELLEQEITLEFEPLSIESLGNINISPAAILALENIGFLKGGDSQ